MNMHSQHARAKQFVSGSRPRALADFPTAKDQTQRAGPYVGCRSSSAVPSDLSLSLFGSELNKDKDIIKN
jgi:hypothetical protein